MKDIDPIKAFRTAAIFFLVALLLKSWGPFSSGDSFARNVVVTLFTTVLFVIILAFFKQFEKNPHAKQLVQLDHDTAEHVDALLGEGKNVAAVKAVRDSTGADLKSAAATVKARTHADHHAN